MEPVMFVMAILGCSDAEIDCREVRMAEARYATAAACAEAAPAMLQRNSDIAYPVVMTACRPANIAQATREPLRPQG